MSFIKSKILKLYKSKKVNVLAVFIILALLFSLLTKLSKDYTKTIAFNIEMQNIPDEHIVLNDSLHTIKVTISTYGFNFLKYYFINPSLKVNFDELKKTPSHYLWIKNNEFQNVVNQFNPGIAINGINPDTIYFEYDSYFVKKVPIRLKHQIKFASGFDVENKYSLEPDSVKVIGARTVVDTITKVETEILILDDVNTDVSNNVKLKLPNNNQDFKFSVKRVIVNGSVKKFTEGSLMVPIVITNLPENVQIKYFPKEVEVTFYTSLDNYKSVTPNSFKVECDYRQLTNENNKLIPTIVKQPQQVRNVKLGVKSIEFIIL